MGKPFQAMRWHLRLQGLEYAISACLLACIAPFVMNKLCKLSMGFICVANHDKSCDTVQFMYMCICCSNMLRLANLGKTAVGASGCLESQALQLIQAML